MWFRIEKRHSHNNSFDYACPIEKHFRPPNWASQGCYVRNLRTQLPAPVDETACSSVRASRGGMKFRILLQGERYLYRGAQHRSRPCVPFARFKSEIWILNVLVAPYFWVFVCLSRCRLLFFAFSPWWTLETTAAPSRLLCTWKQHGSCPFIMENGRMALKERESILFVIFGTSMMILHNTTLQRPFPKLKNHHPTRLYMIYPMMQSVAHVCVEKYKKKALQGGIVHCHWKSIVHHGKPFWHSNF